MLARDGYEVAAVPDAASALKELGSRPYDLLFVPAPLHDELPGGGLPGAVIVSCASGELDAGVAALGRGALAYVTRPYRADEVTHIVRRAEERERLVREVQGLR